MLNRTMCIGFAHNIVPFSIYTFKLRKRIDVEDEKKLAQIKTFYKRKSEKIINRENVTSIAPLLETKSLFK